MRKPATVAAEVDLVAFEIIWHRLMQVSEEMGISYIRTSGSHVLITGNDGATGIMLADGSLVNAGPYIITQANVLSSIVRSTIATCSDYPGIHDGDVFICNDPYLGAIHQPDIATVAPIFENDELVGWVGASGHQLDTGGMDPGGFSIKAVEVHQEGLRIPPVKLVDRGELRADLLRWILNQVRDPLVGLDIKAQLAALNTGRDRLRALFARYGEPTVSGVMRHSIEFAEQGLRRRIAQLPDGIVREVQHIDHDGHTDAIYSIVCTATKEGDRLTLDFDGTSPQARGLINCTDAGLRAGVLTATYVLLGYDLPWNQGIWNALEVKAPSGIVNNCSYPAPCAMATISAVIVTIDTVFGALTRLLQASEELREEAMALWTGSSLGPVFSGTSQHGFPFAWTEMSHFGGGGGARHDSDGVDTAGIIFNTTPNIPNVEDTEVEYPVLCLFRSHLTDSGGPGKFRGGASGEVAYILHGAPEGRLEASFAGTGAEMPNAYGLAGGLPGACVRAARIVENDPATRLDSGKPLPNRLEEIAGTVEWLPPKHGRTPFLAGDVWFHNWQGAGGYGDPLTRDPALVAADVRAHIVSEEAAHDVYGVVLAGLEPGYDADATDRRRAEMRAERIAPTLPRPITDPPDPLGSVRVGEHVVAHISEGRYCCRSCGEDLGALADDLHSGAVTKRLSVAAAGRKRGENYDHRGRFFLRVAYCPGCATQLHADVGLDGEPEPFVRYRWT